MISKLALGFAVAVLATFLMPVSEALAVCCGGGCCCLDGDTQGPGDVNPANPCEVCDPSTDQMSWTPVADCTPDAGVDEDAGVSTEEDAGTAATDAGTTGTDAGTTTGTDSGPPASMDAGPTDDDSGSDDGGCAAGGTGAFGGLFGLLLLGLRRKKGMHR